MLWRRGAAGEQEIHREKDVRDRDETVTVCVSRANWPGSTDRSRTVCEQVIHQIEHIRNTDSSVIVRVERA